MQLNYVFVSGSNDVLPCAPNHVAPLLMLYSHFLIPIP